MSSHFEDHLLNTRTIFKRCDDVSSEGESRSALLSSYIFGDLVLGSSALKFVLETSPRNVGLKALEFILSLVYLSAWRARTSLQINVVSKRYRSAAPALHPKLRGVGSSAAATHETHAASLI